MKKNSISTFLLIYVIFNAGITSNIAQRLIKENDFTETWMTEALPIENEPLGAMLFGGTHPQRIQYNEISFWSRDRMPKEDRSKEDMDAHQVFGNNKNRLGHDFSKVKNYKRELDISKAIHNGKVWESDTKNLNHMT